MDEKYVLLSNLGCMSFILNYNITYREDSLQKKSHKAHFLNKQYNILFSRVTQYVMCNKHFRE